MKVGVVILPEHRWPEARALWRRVEELGFDSAWTYDHLTWRTLRDRPWFAAVPTLAAAALATERIRLGPLVASITFRHPVPFAKELMTLDDLSGGRLTLGIGAGGLGHDAAALGGEPWSARERSQRFAEFVGLLDRVLREPATTARGRWYSAEQARSIPGCVQRPRLPFAVAAHGPRALRVAARFGDAWVTTASPPGSPGATTEQCAAYVRDRARSLDEACAALGRDPRTIERMVLLGTGADRPLASVDAFVDCAGRYAEIGIDELVVPHPRATEPYAGDPSVLERIALEALPGLRVARPAG
ncbi:MAG TPA: LLM class flavin-dependent oxidoreductase [Candidatus Binatia bacterium]|nr:LLM class flavin-dependent oxidoreductase [Candidatus Binatia bacterium]